MNVGRAILIGVLLIGFSLHTLAEDSVSMTNQPDRRQVELLRNKAGEFYNRADYANALETLKQAIKVAEAVWGDKSTNVAGILDLTAGVYRIQGDRSNALVLGRRSIAIREKALGSEHPDVATSLFALASLYNDIGDYAQGLQLGKRCLEIREKAFGREHQDVASSLAMLSRICVNQGDYPQALEAMERAFAYWEKHFETNPYIAVTCLSDMASINQDLGNYDYSLRLYQKAAALYEELYGPDQPSLAACWNNIASVYEVQGNYAEALDFQQRSLSLYLRVFGPEHPEVGIGLNNTAKTLGLLGKQAEAMKLYQRALSVLEKALGEGHPDVASVLNNIADLYQQQGESSKALALFQRSVDINLKVFGNEHPRLASALNNLASVCESQGRIAEALICYERSLVIEERVLGSFHPQVISILQNIAGIWMRQNNVKAALEEYAESFRRRRAYLVLQFSAATDEEALRAIDRNHLWEQIFHSLCGAELAGGKAAVLGAEELALNKGTLEEVRSTQAALESDIETATQMLGLQRQSTLARLERLPKRGLDPKQQAVGRREIEEELKTIDGKLRERTPLAVRSLEDRSTTPFEIADNLPSEWVFVDVVRFWRFDSTTKTNWWKEQRYAAYLTFSLAHPSTNVVVRRVDLGEAAPVDEAIEIVTKRMSDGQFAAKDFAAAVQRLSELVYLPLSGYLTNTSHLIFCPDGQLSRLPFEMLLVSKAGEASRYLIEEKTISYVGSGREIVRLASGAGAAGSGNPAYNGKGARRGPPLGPALVMGNPDFDLELGTNTQTKEAGGLNSSPNRASFLTTAPTSKVHDLSRSYRGGKFTPLPGSEEEAKSVAKLLGADCVLRVGKEAREADLKAVVSPRVLHLATHGFFLTDQEFKHTNSLRDSWTGSGMLNQHGPRLESDWENPMVRCGVALAGANHAKEITNSTAEDGLLTGLEASLLNLQGTELVILSACDSGTGEVKIGEGVMSLRRAFRIAGAETVLASHWKVSDKATGQLMTEFMRRWRAGEPRAQAWREAQLSLLRSKEFSNPYFWAAFTMTGQWR